MLIQPGHGLQEWQNINNKMNARDTFLNIYQPDNGHRAMWFWIVNVSTPDKVDMDMHEKKQSAFDFIRVRGSQIFLFWPGMKEG